MHSLVRSSAPTHAGRGALLFATTLLAISSGCSCSDPPPASPDDAGSTSTTDATQAVDARFTSPDAPAPSDAGPPCRTAPPPPCDDTDEDVYGFRVVDAAPFCNGTVLACSTVDTVPVSDVALLMPAGLTATTALRRFRIAYRTEREPGVPGVGSAMVFLPETPRDGDPPVMIVGHGTSGLADSCAPSRGIGGDPANILPWAGTGIPVIAVDYAGLGTEGVQGYGVPEDAAYSSLDGGRALLAMLEEPSREIMISGHSQGGFTALSSQAIAAAYAPELSLTGVISFAGGQVGSTETLPIELDASLVIDLLLDLPVDDVTRALLALIMYADFARLFGEERAGEAFAAPVRDAIVTSIQTQCIFALTLDLATPRAGYTPPTTLGTLVDEAFLRAAAACTADDDAGCTEDARRWLALKTQPPVPNDPDGAPVLYFGGATDTIHTPTSFACNVQALEARSIPLESCFVSDADHFTIVARTAPAALAWSLGEPLACPSPGAPPRCGL